jgi:cyclophilin family peptidyl-prolyl cis-trans isomerase
MVTKPRVFFDIVVDSEPSNEYSQVGRIVFELFAQEVPKTCENFIALCRGDQEGMHYKGSRFHRIIKDFMVQGGDFLNGDGTGGRSIYGDVFDDESFDRKHDQPCLLSMANRGPNTNASQFFITSTPCPHLDDKHVVFGRIVQGEEVFRKMENIPTNDEDEPTKLIVIAHCGELLPESKRTVVDSVSEAEEKTVEDENPQDDSNPYVIGVAPPLDTEVQQRFLGSGVGRKAFRPRNRPESATDKSGRKIKGRGMIV